MGMKAGGLGSLSLAPGQLFIGGEFFIPADSFFNLRVVRCVESRRRTLGRSCVRKACARRPRKRKRTRGVCFWGDGSPPPPFAACMPVRGARPGRFTRRLKPCPDERRLLFAFSSRLIVA